MNSFVRSPETMTRRCAVWGIQLGIRHVKTIVNVSQDIGEWVGRCVRLISIITSCWSCFVRTVSRFEYYLSKLEIMLVRPLADKSRLIYGRFLWLLTVLHRRAHRIRLDFRPSNCIWCTLFCCALWTHVSPAVRSGPLYNRTACKRTVSCAYSNAVSIPNCRCPSMCSSSTRSVCRPFSSTTTTISRCLFPFSASSLVTSSMCSPTCAVAAAAAVDVCYQDFGCSIDR